jgi:hypothetical protein
MLGQQSKAQKIVARAKGWDPDLIWDSKTQSYGPPNDALGTNQESAVFTNQGVPSTQGKYPQLEDGYDVRNIGPDEVDFNHPTPRSGGNNAPTPKARGDSFPGMDNK